MTHEALIRELQRLFPTPPLYQTPRLVSTEEWILQRGIEAGRAQVIDYLKDIWGLSPQSYEDDDNVSSPQNRISADEYCRATAPYPANGADYH